MFIQHGLGHIPQLRLLLQEAQQPQEQSFLQSLPPGKSFSQSGVQSSHSPPVSASGPLPANLQSSHLPHTGPQD